MDSQEQTHFDLILVGTENSKSSTMQTLQDALVTELGFAEKAVLEILDSVPKQLKRFETEQEARSVLKQLQRAGGRVVIVERTNTERGAAVPDSKTTHTDGQMSTEKQAQRIDELLTDAHLYAKAENWTKAIEVYNEVLSLSPTNRSALLASGNAYFSCRDYALAEERYRHFTEVDPQHPGGHYNLANVLVKLNRFEEALTIYDKAMSLSPCYNDALLNKGNLLKQMHRYQDALLCYRQILQIDPTYQAAQHNLKALEQHLSIAPNSGDSDDVEHSKETSETISVEEKKSVPEQRFDPKIFRAKNVKSAKKIILTADASLSSDERWEKETPFLCNALYDQLRIDESHLLVDFGCGIGRIAKELIQRYRCRVLGVDLSPEMRQMAIRYVNSDRFAVCSPNELPTLSKAGLLATHLYSIWVLQHCERPDVELSNLTKLIPEGGKFFVANTVGRLIPADTGLWMKDGVDVAALLQAALGSPIAEVQLSPEIMNPRYIAAHYCRVYQKSSRQPQIPSLSS